MLARSTTPVPGIQAPAGVLTCSGALLAPRRLIGLWARVRGRALNERLARGADPREGPALAARAAQLAGPATRARIAAGLERLALAQAGSARHFIVSPLPGAIAPNREALLALAQMLRSPRPLYAGGIAAAWLILVDGTGPAYTDPRGEALARALADADARLRS